MFAVPMEYLGITAYDRIALQFKAVDSDNVIDEPEDFYIEGDCAPLGRPNFIYQTYIPGVTEGDGTPILTLSERALHPTEDVTETPTQAADTEPAASETDAETDRTDKGGCKSALPALASVVLLLGGAALTGKRKIREN